MNDILSELTNEKNEHETVWKFVPAVVVLVLIAFAAFLLAGVLEPQRNDDGVTTIAARIQERSSNLQTQSARDVEDVRQLRAFVRAANYGAAVDETERIFADGDSDTDPNKRAYYAWASAGAYYKANRSIDDAIVGIRRMKESVNDTTVALPLRARIATTIANIYYGPVGRDERVFNEIFTGEPFAGLRTDDAFESTRRVYQWSYDLYPTARAALMLARWHVITPIERERDTRDAAVAEHVRMADALLQEAADLFARERERAAPSPASRMAASYRYWRTYIRTMLAYLDPSTYTTDYRSEYESIIDSFMRSPSTEVRQYVPYARWLYADFLVRIDGDTDAAREQLREAVAAVNADPNRDVNEFLTFIKNTPATETTLITARNLFSNMIRDAMRLEPTFRDFVISVNPDLSAWVDGGA